MEEGHLFRWTCTYEDEEGKTVALDYGLVPGGVFVALLHLVDGPTLKQVQALETEMGGAE